MEQGSLPFSRIRTVRSSNPREFTAEGHRIHYLLPHADPVYPFEARAQGVEGTVVLDIQISRDGETESVSVRSGPELLAGPAAEAVRAWRYRPTAVNGVPVAVTTDLEVTYRLPDSVTIS